MLRRQRLMIATAVAVAATLGLAGTDAAAAAKPPTLKTTLLEFKIKTKPKTVAAGKVRVVAKNIGAEKHELVIARASDPSALVTKPNGAVDESQIAKTDKVGEIAGVKPKQTKSKVFNLTPGTYVLFCNIIDTEPDGSKLSHYVEGMSTILTVT